MTDVREVRLVGLPVPLWESTSQHTDELLREFALMAAGRASGTVEDDVPGRLTALITALQAQYGAGADEREEPLRAAAAAGRATLDLSFPLPVAAADAAADLDRMLDEADEYCAQGRHLLTLASPPEVVRFRRWYLSEVTAQLGGADPTPWDRAG